jgi:hypothetical protein
MLGDGKCLIMEQNEYIKRLPCIPIARSAKSFATARGQVAYATNNTRPDGTCDVNMACQIRSHLAEERDFKNLEDLIKRIKNALLSLRFQKLDLSSGHLRACSDSSFANNGDLTSQIEYTIFLVDATGCANLLCWSSRKCERETRSVLAAELYALSAAYDMGFAIRHTLSTLLHRTVEMHVFTDSQTLWNSVTSLCKTEEKSLSIDVAGLRQACRTGELRHFGRVQTRYNPADSMTERKASTYLVEILNTGIMTPPVELMIRYGRVQDRNRK